MSILNAATHKCRSVGSGDWGPVMGRKIWALAAAAVLVVVVAAPARSSRQAPSQALAGQPAAANTAQVQQRTLTAMVSQPGMLTYRARPDGSPYAVINQTQGTYTTLPASGQVIAQGHVLYRVTTARWCCCVVRPPPIGRSRPA